MMLSPGKQKSDEEIQAFANSYKRYLKARVQGTASGGSKRRTENDPQQSSAYKYERDLEIEQNLCVTPR